MKISDEVSELTDKHADSGVANRHCLQPHVEKEREREERKKTENGNDEKGKLIVAAVGDERDHLPTRNPKYRRDLDECDRRYRLYNFDHSDEDDDRHFDDQQSDTRKVQ